ncbi:hypothetical protein [Sphingobium abikonense]|uniref:hypothetical protein n=1 Tax=Sphingobium abikonense TaxID=86193 RepID=UPI003517516F
MTGHIRTPRPARAAIAAVLAFTATPVLAQDMGSAASAPTMTPDATIITPPAMTQAPTATTSPAIGADSPTTPVFQPSAPVVQQTAPIEQRIAEARAAAEAEQAERRPAERSVTQQATVTRETAAASTESQPVTSPANRPAAPVAAPESPTANRATAEAAPGSAEPLMPPAPTAQADRTDQAILWAMGGGALLLLGLGGAALMRRRRPEEGEAMAVPTYESAVSPPAMASTATASPIAPEPVDTAPTTRPALQPRPAMVTASDATLAAMVAAPPSPENPFTTRAKRMRRARFLLAQRDGATRIPDAPQTVHAEPAAAPSPAVQDRGQMVYRFDKDNRRASFLKPRTN